MCPSVLIISIAIPGAISSLQVSVDSEQQLSISWTGLPGIDTYFIQVTNYSGDIAATRSVDMSISFIQISTGIGMKLPIIVIATCTECFTIIIASNYFVIVIKKNINHIYHS